MPAIVQKIIQKIQKCTVNMYNRVEHERQCHALLITKAAWHHQNEQGASDEDPGEAQDTAPEALAGEREDPAGGSGAAAPSGDQHALNDGELKQLALVNQKITRLEVHALGFARTLSCLL